MADREGEQHGRGQETRGRDGRAEALRDDHGVEARQAQTAGGLGHEERRHAELREAAPDRPGVTALGDAAHGVEGDFAGEEAAHAVREHVLLFGESELHAAPSLRIFGSRGMPRPRSLMMFFWIWLVPPPMIRPRKYMYWFCQLPPSRSSGLSP